MRATYVGLVGAVLVLVVAGGACGSSKSSSSTTSTSGSAPSSLVGSSTTVAAPSSSTDPCSLLTDAEVRTIAPGVGSGTLDTVGGGQHICDWKNASGIPHVQVQVFSDSSSPRSLLMEQLAPSGYTIVEVSGVGDAAAAAFQQANPARNLNAGLAALDVKTGGRHLWISTPGLDIEQGTAQFTQVTQLASSALKRLSG